MQKKTAGGRKPKARHLPRKDRRTPKIRQLMGFLRTKLQDPSFFNSLPMIKTCRVRTFDFRGLPIVVKQAFSPQQGANFKALRRTFLQHQRAVRSGAIKPKHYGLKTIKVYGKIGDKLVMRRVGEVKPKSFGLFGYNSFRRAKIELQYNLFKALSKRFAKKRLPQDVIELMSLIENEASWSDPGKRASINDAIFKLPSKLRHAFYQSAPAKARNFPQIMFGAFPSTNTNPKNPLKGKWVLYAPYDIV